jgi:hypothetical protein
MTIDTTQILRSLRAAIFLLMPFDLLHARTYLINLLGEAFETADLLFQVVYSPYDLSELGGFVRQPRADRIEPLVDTAL